MGPTRLEIRRLGMGLAGLVASGAFAVLACQPPTSTPSPVAFPEAAAKLSPPVAERRPHELELHGEVRVDDYYWLRNRDDPEVLAYLRAENEYTEASMAPLDGLRKDLYEEIVGRVQETDLEVPVRIGKSMVYSRTEAGKQYAIDCRKRIDATGEWEGSPEEVLLDLNALAEDLDVGFIDTGDFALSNRGEQLAYTLDLTGYRQYSLRIKRLADGKHAPVEAERVTSVAWSGDDTWLFYVTEDAVTKRSDTLWRVLADGSRPPEKLRTEADERFELSVHLTRSKGFVVVTAGSHTTSEVSVLAADDPQGVFQVVAPRRQGQEYYVDHRDDRFFIRTNDTGRNFRLVTAPTDSPGRDHWREQVAHDPDVMLERVSVFESYLVISERRGGLQQLRIVGPGSSEQTVTFPESVYSAYLGHNPNFDQKVFRYRYASFVTPESVMEYDASSGRSSLLKREPVLGGFDPQAYETHRLWATADDGARIPISMVVPAGRTAGEGGALYLVGYGAYGSSYPVSFRSERLSLLDRGVAVAIAHVRGGGEMGKAWHDAGRMEHKRNSFTDFVAVADALVERGWADRERLAIQGGSAGGLLMGAVLNARPDVAGAALLHVPFVDVLTTMSDESLPLTVGEFEEWGNPKVKADYDVMRTYCPYTNLAAGEYPAMLVKTSLNDSQVMYFEPAKYVAKLRTLRQDDAPLFLHVNMDGGHGGSSGRYDQFRETAFDYAFILDQLRARTGP